MEGGRTGEGILPGSVEPGENSVGPGWYRPPFRGKLPGRAPGSVFCTIEAVRAYGWTWCEGLSVWEVKVGEIGEIERLRRIRRGPRPEILGGGWFQYTPEVPTRCR